MDILIKSILSGLVTALVLVIAKFAGPRLAGAIGGIPIVFAVSYIFLTMNAPPLRAEPSGRHPRLFSRGHLRRAGRDFFQRRAYLAQFAIPQNLLD